MRPGAGCQAGANPRFQPRFRWGNLCHKAGHSLPGSSSNGRLALRISLEMRNLPVWQVANERKGDRLRYAAASPRFTPG